MEKFAIFILSHNRANNISALAMLKKSNYSGMWYVVVSTDNMQLGEYKKIVPNDHLLIFDKATIDTDLMVSHKTNYLGASIFARNYIVNYAKDRYKYFCMIDDDIENINFRIDHNGKMKSINANKYFNNIIKAIIEYLSGSTNLSGIALTSDRKYFGGRLALDKIEREIFCFMIFKSDDIRSFRGLNLEDCLLSCINFDKVYHSLKSVSFNAPSPGTNLGGVEYKSKYDQHFLWVVACPSAVKVTTKGGRIRTNKYMYPQIINQKYKKL